ncbi:zinc-ribbon domain-containing protein [Ramlibacter sp. USB13]|uniref:Zinc-ribbon domain-containing protein n=1 Tax=Ramlibacter cellulosilyticus TaxID=2764187 RepID=A0A923MXL6_9BURK|nr:DUF3426 domain-containing protein [Ramlibacter cellulosilyticus]MBC5786004.1 zinc-ribbon domain-containing protein [Ramlibacter cellulosilyticus]
MSLITSCPACGTMFRVVPDQLKISEGWVRCGHCSEVFDATAHLTDESVLGALPEAQATRSAGLQDTPVAPPDPAPQRAVPPQPATVPAELQTRPAELYARAPAPAPAPDAVPASADQPAPATSDRSDDPSSFFDDEGAAEALKPSPLDAPFIFRRPEISLKDLGEQPEPGTESQILPEDLMPPSLLELEEEEVPDVSFVRKARRRSFWRRPFVRMVLALLVLLLGALLALQVGYQDRDRLALAQPALKPVLERMCGLMDCTLSAPRQIEAIVIDSSGFNRLRGDTYRLAFTLRNTAPVEVAVPAMELTVTDAQDQTLARRVLTPAELGAAQGAIPAAGEWSRTVGVALDTGGSARVAGYRLLAFYP